MIDMRSDSDLAETAIRFKKLAQPPADLRATSGILQDMTWLLDVSCRYPELGEAVATVVHELAENVRGLLQIMQSTMQEMLKTGPGVDVKVIMANVARKMNTGNMVDYLKEARNGHQN